MENEFDRIKRELEQREQLRIELLEGATRHWLESKDHNYAASARIYNLTRMQLRNYILKKYGARSNRHNMQKDTDGVLQAVTLQTPKQS